MYDTPLLFFADDWGRHPSSSQHLVRHLLPQHDVYWVNTIGMRRPRLDWVTLQRGVEKVLSWTKPAPIGPALPPGLTLANPRMWPWFRSGFDRKLNQMLLTRQLGRLIRTMPLPPVAVTTIPIVADVMDQLPVAHWVYYCVDDFAEWPGHERQPLLAMEQRLIDRAECLIAVSEHLQDKLGRVGRQVELLTHGVDIDFWRRPTGPVPAGIDCVERPLVVFFGVIDRRLDLDFVRRLGETMDEGTILLVGPAHDPDPALWRVPRVRHLPPVAYDSLPRLAAEAAALIMPYVDVPVTRAMQPLKLKEYLAAGKPVVVRRLPATEPWTDCLDMADTPEAFAAAVKLRVRHGVSGEQKSARSRLAGESWEAKARAFREFALAPLANADERELATTSDSR